MNDSRLRYDEPATGFGHPTLPDSVNRIMTADHNIDGTHRLWVDVRSFGAIGDGATDDTIAIQAAINYANTIATGTLARSVITVYMPCGDFKITSQLIVKAKVNLHCDGVIYNYLADKWQIAVVFKAGSHCAKLQLYGFLGSGVVFGEAGLSCNMHIGEVRLWNIGEEYDGINGSKIGVRFIGYDFDFNHIEIDGGNIGVDFNACSDVRGADILVFTAATAVRVTSGSEHIHIGYLDIDSPNWLGLQIDTSHDITIDDCSIFLNDTQVAAGLTNACVVGQYSATDKVNNLDLNLRVQNTGGQAIKILNAKDTRIDLIASNALLGTGNAHLITSAIEFGIGVEPTVMIDANIDGIASLVTGTGGCVRYTEGGALKYRGSNGTITTLGAA